MNHFEAQDGELHCEDVPLTRIAEAVGTPVYVYSSATLERHYTVLRDAFVDAGLGQPLIAYAVKANSNVAVLRTCSKIRVSVSINPKAARGSPSRGCPTEPGLMKNDLSPPSSKRAFSSTE